MSVSNETQLILDTIANSTREVETRITSKLDSIKDEIQGLCSAVANNAKRITKIEAMMEQQMTKVTHTSKLAKRTAQTILKNAIVIRGFPNNEFDEHEVAQNIITICDLKHGFDDCYKFSRNIGIDRETNVPRNIYIMHLSFLSNMDKIKVFKRLKESGHFTLNQLLATCPDDLKSHQIWIDHALTHENLQIRKLLMSLKRDEKIERFALRSGTFVLTIKNADGSVKTVTVCELEQLNKWFPVDPSQEAKSKRPRPRHSDSSSPSSTHPATKQKKDGPYNNKRTTTNIHRMKPNQ